MDGRAMIYSWSIDDETYCNDVEAYNVCNTRHGVIIEDAGDTEHGTAKLMQN
jgi:hypothetical protein